MKNKDIQLLRDINDAFIKETLSLGCSPSVQPIHLSESQRLRQMADEIERKEDLSKRFKEYINSLEII